MKIECYGPNKTLLEVDVISEICQKFPYYENCYYGKWQGLNLRLSFKVSSWKHLLKHLLFRRYSVGVW